MGKNPISRKEFFTKALAGIAGISLVSKNLTCLISSGPKLRGIGDTGIMVSPICFGAPRTNDESLIKYALEKGMNFIDTGRTYGNGNKGIGVIAMKTCSGGKYSPTADIEPSYKEAVLWVLRHKFISSAAIAMANFEQVDEHTSWLKDL